MQADKVTAAWVADAKKTVATKGDPATWSAFWATDTQKKAQEVFTHVTFGPETAGAWTCSTQKVKDASVNKTKKEQLTKGGARLAQLLKVIWPDAQVAAGTH
jgi:hypothetical protein